MNNTDKLIEQNKRKMGYLKRLAFGYIGFILITCLIFLPVLIGTNIYVALVFISIFLYLGLHKIYSRYRFHSYLGKFYSTIKQGNNQRKSIEDILNLIDKFYTIISLENKSRKLPSLIKNERKTGGYNDRVLHIVETIKELRSDLALRLTEQQSTLEQAKSEVSTHIHGTDELNQVSELQRQRLDQQIAQFEELQRVLVKV